MTAASSSLSGLHLLLSYQCTYECDHCFVWGGPFQTGTMSLDTVETIINQAVQLGSIEWIYYEGGEPFLYYAVLRSAVVRAKEHGFKVGIVTNAYWANSEKDARECLEPFAGSVDDLSISSDSYHHGGEKHSKPETARSVARQLGIPVNFISIAEPGAPEECGDSAVLYRGRAARMLASRVPPTPWRKFTACPWEELRNPQRVHVDPYGHLHICQGISIGNLLQRPLPDILADFRPDEHPIVGPLLDGGPAELVDRYGLPHEEGYSDHCHLCYEARCNLRTRFPDELTPDQMYGST